MKSKQLLAGASYYCVNYSVTEGKIFHLQNPAAIHTELQVTSARCGNAPLAFMTHIPTIFKWASETAQTEVRISSHDQNITTLPPEESYAFL